ncbi:hypothetical protein AX16_005129 [Volvariella volvacea WC 439]|nr:hypothetical protein AX16_005129 [Volvariella volvacea WC 439]
MGETFALPSHNASNTPAQPTLPSIVAEDDEEPPSSGYNLRPSQMTSAGLPARSASSLRSSSHIDIVEKPADTVATVNSNTVGSSAPQGRPDIVATPALASAIVAENEKSTKAGDVENLAAATPKLRNTWRRPRLSRTARIRALFTPSRPLGPPPTYKQSLKATLKYTPLNLLLLAIPVSWALHFTHQSPTLIFVFSALGIIPLAALLGLGTEQVALRTSQSVGGLLNATLGNVIEMIISGIALRQCELELIQSSLLGGLLSNLLLVLGMAFLIGGMRVREPEFHPRVAQLNSSLLIVSVFSLGVPVAFHQYLESRLPQGREVAILLQLSRGTAVILIVIYIAYLVFQFYSHNHLFLDSVSSGNGSSRNNSIDSRDVETFSASTTAGALTRQMSAVSSSSSSSSDSSDSVEMPKLNMGSALFLLAFCTSFAYVTADCLVESLEGLVAQHPNISKEWITLIIIPIIGNAAEHTTAVVVASKGKFDLAMSVAVGSSLQIALFVIPILVTIAWGLGKPLTLLFDPLETIVLFFSVLLVKFSVEDGRSHWMSGLVLLAAYLVIALAFWNFPETIRLLQGEPLHCIRG